MLIADSGGTKTDWLWLGADGRRAFRGPGLNPNHGDVSAALAVNVAELAMAGRRFVLHFYGAGLEGASAQGQIKDQLAAAWPAAEVQVYTDRLAAARAAAGVAAARVCILGTGSTAFIYDGVQITAVRGGQGWLLGDTASGVDMGRRLLVALLDGDMPPQVLADFEALTGMDPLTYRGRLYAAERPALLLAELTPLLAAHRAMPAVQALLSGAFASFIQQDLRSLESTAPVVAVGSVAVHFAPEWQAAIAAAGLPWGGYVADVIGRLGDYHLQARDQ